MEKHMRSSKEVTEAMHNSMWCKADEVAQLESYCDKLADGLPEGMLPKDVELLRSTNAKLMDENDRHLEALRSIAGTNTKPSHLKKNWKEMMLAAKQRAKEALGGE